jgi:hypothetical protein
METKRVDELRDRAGQWRAAAERIIAQDPKAAAALIDLAARLDRQVAMLVYYKAPGVATPVASTRSAASRQAAITKAAR